MKKKWFVMLVVIFAAIGTSAFMLNNPDSRQMAMADTKDSIKKNMRETEERNKKLEAFHIELHEKFKKSGYEGDISIAIDKLFSSEPPSITVRVKDEE